MGATTQDCSTRNQQCDGIAAVTNCKSAHQEGEMSLRRRIVTTATIGLTVIAVHPQGTALGAPTATPLGPEGGDIGLIAVRPHLVLAVIGQSYYEPLDNTTVVWASTDDARTWHRATKSEPAEHLETLYPTWRRRRLFLAVLTAVAPGPDGAHSSS
jgi:hypothetical protein